MFGDIRDGNKEVGEESASLRSRKESETELQHYNERARAVCMYEGAKNNKKRERERERDQCGATLSCDVMQRCSSGQLITLIMATCTRARTSVFSDLRPWNDV